MSCEWLRPIEIYSLACLGRSQLVHRRVAHDQKHGLWPHSVSSSLSMCQSLTHRKLKSWPEITLSWVIFLINGHNNISWSFSVISWSFLIKCIFQYPLLSFNYSKYHLYRITNLDSIIKYYFYATFSTFSLLIKAPALLFNRLYLSKASQAKPEASGKP